MIDAKLVDTLDEISTRAHLPLERRLIETTVWLYRNRPRIPEGDVLRRLAFADKLADCLVELMAMLTQRLQEAEGRPKGTSLWLPAGMKVNGDVRQFS